MNARRLIPPSRSSIESGELPRQGPAKRVADQAPTGDEDGELVHGGEEIDLPRLTPPPAVLLDFLLHDARVCLEALVPQRGKEQAHLFVHHFRGGIVGHAPSEDGDHEPIDLAGAELVIGRLKERGLGPRPRQGGDPGARQSEGEDVAETGAAAPDERDRIPPELESVTQPGQPAGEIRRARHHPVTTALFSPAATPIIAASCSRRFGAVRRRERTGLAPAPQPFPVPCYPRSGAIVQRRWERVRAISGRPRSPQPWDHPVGDPRAVGCPRARYFSRHRRSSRYTRWTSSTMR